LLKRLALSLDDESGDDDRDGLRGERDESKQD